MRVFPLISLPFLAFTATAAEAESAFHLPAPLSDPQTTLADAQALLVCHRPTSNNGGMPFALQGGAVGDLVLPRSGPDVVLGAGVALWVPLADRRMDLRFHVPVVRSDFDGEFAAGIGDLGVRFDWAPAIPGPNGVVLTIDSTWDTATKDFLGVGQHTLAPGAAYVVPVAGGFAVAPSLDQRFSWHGDGPDINVTAIHLHGLWSGDGRFWAQLDPSLVFDHEADASWFALDAEGGLALTRMFSVYVAPGLAFGDERPYNLRISGGLLAAF